MNMEKEIKLLMTIESSKAKEHLLYELLGKFGDKLPDEVQSEIRQMANDEIKNISKAKRKLICNIEMI